MHAVSTLTCPETFGDLKRLSQAADGRRCQYQGARAGEDVTLSLLPLNGVEPAIALAPLEASLRTDAGLHAPSASLSQPADAPSSSGGDHARIDLPGLHVNAGSAGAQLRIAGLTINANGDAAHIQLGGASHATVDAHPGGAEIRAGRTGLKGADFTLVLASDTPGPRGYKAVGYIARGPAAGPLVVGAFRSKGGRYNGQDTDLKRLVDLNVLG